MNMAHQKSQTQYDPVYRASVRIYIFAGASLMGAIASVVEQRYLISVLILILTGVYFFMGYRLRKKPSLALIFLFPILIMLQFAWFAYLESRFRAIDIVLIGLLGLLAIASVYEAYEPIKNIQKS